MKSRMFFVSSAYCNAPPSMTRPNEKPNAASSLASNALVCKKFPSFSKSISRTTTKSPSLSISLHVCAMETAVSSLSPVSIQTSIPAWRNSEIVSGTPSASLSSTAVTPTSWQLVSINSATWLSFSSRSTSDALAEAYAPIQVLNSSSLNTFSASTNVRRPSVANKSRCVRVRESIFAERSHVGKAHRSSTAASAPFKRSLIC
mmetsp:Transcript_8541/g.31970  ORF Transcript_8541/g.31970 Transcript_8541/m.31970 type:complete len:203 (+) Transcript_8541:1604-2212(+)